MAWISGTEWVLDGPHEFLCDDCQLSHKQPYCINAAMGKCTYCGKEGFLQVRRTGETIDEKASNLSCLLIMIAGILFLAYLVLVAK